MSHPIPLVGRDDVVAELRQALAQAEARHGQLVLISGEPGIGKSTLADLVGREATARGATVVFGRAWELAEAPPYFPVWSCLRSLGIEPPQGTSVEADAFHLWERVLEALGAASAARPVVWILEDLHAADLQTLDLLTFLARPLRALGVLLLVTMRDRDPRIGDRTAARLARLCRDGRELRLEALDLTQTRALVESVAGRTLDAASVRELADLTSGNPLFLIECARGYRGGAPVRLPASIRALTDERVALLSEGARDAIACGAIVGREFSAAVVSRMLGGLPAQVIERLTPALRAGLVIELRPGQFRFSHILVRDAVEESLGAARCAELHARAAAALAVAGDAVDVLVERARHALASMRSDGDPVGLALRAARTLTSLGAHDRALALYQRIEDAFAAGLSEARADPEEALHRATVARAAGRHAEANRRCEAVLTDARAARDGVLMARAALALGAELRPGTVNAGLIAALREALAALPPGEATLRCRVEARLAGALQPAADPTRPMALARAAIAAARALDDPALMVEVLHTAGAALVDYAPLEERLALDDELLERATAQGDWARVLLAHARLVMSCAERGDFEAVDRHIDQAREVSTELGHPRWRWRPLLLESMRAIAHGDFELSDRFVVEVQQQASLTDDPALTTSLSAHMATRAMHFHHDEQIRATLDHISQLMEHVPEADTLMACIRMSAWARMEDADATARELERVRGRLPVQVGDFRYLVGEAIALVGTREDRLLVQAAVLPIADRHMGSGHIPITYEGPNLRLLGLIESALGEHDRALARLEEALRGARERGHALWVAQINYDRGRVLLAAGRGEEAARAFGEVAPLADQLGMTGLAKRARARMDARAPVTHAPEPRVAVALHREGDVWRIEAGSRSLRVRHSRGIELLARLVERPGEELHVLALASDAGATLVESDAGEALDAQARREYKARLAELTEALEEAERDNDLGRKARLSRERDAIESELARAIGLGGRARPAASATERARVNAQRRLKDAVTRIGEADAAVGALFSRAVHTGTYCCFRP